MLLRVESAPEQIPSEVPEFTEDLLAAKEIFNNLPSAPDARQPKDEARTTKKIEKYLKRRRNRPLKIIAGLAGAATALSSLSFVYQMDTEANETLAASSHSAINSLDKEQAPLLASSTFYFAGFDTLNGDVFGQKVGKIGLQQIIPGNNESIDYGDAPLNPEKLAKMIISLVETQGLESISLAGNSMGGEIAATVADYIITNTDINVQSLILNSTPDGTKGLRPETQGNLTTMVDTLRLLPRSEYSTAARWAITMAQEHDRYTNNDLLTNIQNLGATAIEVANWVGERRRPGTWLLVDQAGAIKNSDLQATLAHIGEQRSSKYMPVVVYMGAKDPKDDTVVDIATSSHNIYSYARDAGLSCFTVPVEHAIHTSYLYDSKAYHDALALQADDIKAAIDRERSYYEMTRTGYYSIGDFPTVAR